MYRTRQLKATETNKYVIYQLMKKCLMYNHLKSIPISETLGSFTIKNNVIYKLQISYTSD